MTHVPRRPIRRVGQLVGLAACLIAAGCSVMGNGTGEDGDAKSPTRVVLVTHESFVLPDELIANFEADSGLTLVVKAAGDAGTLTNKLVLTQSNPTGDVAFGVDNTFASRALEAGVFTAYDRDLPAGAAQYRLEGDETLAPVDQANVCVNVDTTWFGEKKLTPPGTLEDLTKPEYRDLLVVPGAATSSPGMAFLLSTIAEYGDRWPDYWTRLMENGVKLTSGWSDAYYVDFTQGGESGKRPIVVSYDSSPAFTVPKGQRVSTTSALLKTCFQQVEYAGVLAGADNPDGAKKLIDFLLTAEVQAALPDSMYVFPVRAGTPLPPAWADFAVQPAAPYEVDPAEIARKRDDWLRQWTEVTTR
jgi:thiamine transport system substrate-binding protein